MNTVKDYLGNLCETLEQFETALRGTIANQNISDIVASARAKLTQAASHPDAKTELSKLDEEARGRPHADLFQDPSKQGSG